VQAASVTVYPGDRGSAVREVEADLGQLGYYHGPLDGIYGPELGAAVREFQAQHRLSVDGVVGPETWAALNSNTRARTISDPVSSNSTDLLREGDTGSAVAHVQALLDEHGFHLVQDGIFGPETLAAVEAFQRENGLAVDGIVGPETLAALNKAELLSAPAPTSAGYLQLGSTGEAVLVLQRELTDLGFNTYGEDGIFGPDTRAAVMAFQAHEGLAVDGIVGPETLAALQRALATVDRGAPTTPSYNAGLGYAIAGFAESLVGDRYMWGGTSPATGFDCSGLVMYVYAHFGVNLPRTSYDQFDVGTPITYNELEPGDLVFFDTDAPGASHVGIYIGGGRFVAADTYATGVTIDAFSAYWLSHFVGARRPPGV
jgi:peptidoglycan hydrolase-like protein with peptidoglycan-binding domain